MGNSTQKSALTLAGLLSTIAISMESQAAAETKVNLCNRNSQTIYISVAYEPEAGQPFMARGWWAVKANDCAELKFPLGSDKLLLHANSESGVLQWLGDQKLCVDTANKFDFADAASRACTGDGLETRGFKELSIANLTSLTPGETPKYEFVASDAVKIGSLVKVCNDSGEDTYLSLAQSKPDAAAKIVNGWFKITPDSCFETLRDSTATELLIFAQNTNGALRWNGDVPLCTDNYDGFSFLEAQSMDCTGDNQRMQNFRKISMTASSSDFEYHLRAEDSRPVRSTVDICNTRADEIFVASAWENLEFPGQVVSSGWLNLEPGKCFENLAVNGNALMLHAENDELEVLLDGTFKACVNLEDGFEFGKSTQMECSGEDLEMLGFATMPLAAGHVRIDIP